MVEGMGGLAVLPGAEIRDWPALAYRGFMMDLGHGQLLRVPEIERQIDHLARFKANQYYFYSEATIELDGYSLVNPNGRYTREEIRHIIDYGRQRHVDVVPCLELYGHLHDLFRVEQFSDLSLPRYGGEFDPRNPRVLQVLDDWVEQTAKLFPSPWYHAGFDEPWALGQDRCHRGQRSVQDLHRRASSRCPAGTEAQQATDVLGGYAERRPHIFQTPRVDSGIAQGHDRRAVGVRRSSRLRAVS